MSGKKYVIIQFQLTGKANFNLYIVYAALYVNKTGTYFSIKSAALGECAEDKMSLKTIHDLDGVRLVWSLLKNPSVRVRTSIFHIR